MKIEVTQADISNGLFAATHCPVALALRRAYPKRENIHVGPYVMQIGSRNVSTPYKVRAFTRAFDDFKAVKPFTFEVPDA